MFRKIWHGPSALILQWSDYSAKPEHDYTYTVTALYGTPTTLKEGSAVSVRIATEPELGKPLSVF